MSSARRCRLYRQSRALSNSMSLNMLVKMVLSDISFGVGSLPASARSCWIISSSFAVESPEQTRQVNSGNFPKIPNFGSRVRSSRNLSALLLHSPQALCTAPLRNHGAEQEDTWTRSVWIVPATLSQLLSVFDIARARHLITSEMSTRSCTKYAHRMIPLRNVVACSPSRIGLFSIASASIALNFQSRSLDNDCFFLTLMSGVISRILAESEWSGDTNVQLYE